MNECENIMKYLDKLVNIKEGELVKNHKVSVIQIDNIKYLKIENDSEYTLFSAKKRRLKVVENTSEDFLDGIKEYLEIAESRLLQEFKREDELFLKLKKYMRSKLSSSYNDWESKEVKILKIINDYTQDDIFKGLVETIEGMLIVLGREDIKLEKRKYLVIKDGNQEHLVRYRTKDESIQIEVKIDRTWGRMRVIDKILRYLIDNVGLYKKDNTMSILAESPYSQIYENITQIENKELRRLVEKLEENFSVEQVAIFNNEYDYQVDVLVDGKVQSILITPYLEKVDEYRYLELKGIVYYDLRFPQYIEGLYQEIENKLIKD